MNICECFSAKYDSHSSSRLVDCCLGTKEKDVCKCNGDETKCDFYDYVRERAIKAKQEEADKFELEFYRDWVLEHDMLFELMKDYDEWKKRYKE